MTQMIKFFLALVILMIGIMVTDFIQAAPINQNFVRNGNFEDDDPAGWRINDIKKIKRVRSNFNGKQAILIRDDGWIAQQLTQPLTPNQTYVIRARVKLKKTPPLSKWSGQARLILNRNLRLNGETLAAKVASKAGKSRWQLLEIKRAFSEEELAAPIYIGITGFNNEGGEFLVDDISFIPRTTRTSATIKKLSLAEQLARRAASSNRDLLDEAKEAVRTGLASELESQDVPENREIDKVEDTELEALEIASRKKAKLTQRYSKTLKDDFQEGLEEYEQSAEDLLDEATEVLSNESRPLFRKSTKEDSRRESRETKRSASVKAESNEERRDEPEQQETSQLNEVVETIEAVANNYLNDEARSEREEDRGDSESSSDSEYQEPESIAPDEVSETASDTAEASEKGIQEGLLVIQNGGFENLEKVQAVNWENIGRTHLTASWVHSGRYAAKISHVNRTEEGPLLRQLNIPLTLGKFYQLRAWIRCDFFDGDDEGTIYLAAHSSNSDDGVAPQVAATDHIVIA